MALSLSFQAEYGFVGGLANRDLIKGGVGKGR